MAGIHPQLKEEWRKCQRFPMYSVSTQGNVRNDKRMRCLTKRLSNSRGGYVVGVCDTDGKGHTVTVARLVAEAFIPNEHGAVEVVHISDQTDDSVKNLKWRMLAPQSEIEGERWVDIEGYEGRYQVSDHGRVRSISFNQTGKTLILKPSVSSEGYYSVGLYDGTRRQQRKYLHRLVAQAFLDNPDNLPHVNHRDENPANNRADNLEWMSADENNKFGGRQFRAGLHRGNRLNQRSLDGRYIRTFDSAADVERTFGYCRQVITRAAANGTPAYGFLWQLDREERGTIRMPIIHV